MSVYCYIGSVLICCSVWFHIHLNKAIALSWFCARGFQKKNFGHSIKKRNKRSLSTPPSECTCLIWELPPRKRRPDGTGCIKWRHRTLPPMPPVFGQLLLNIKDDPVDIESLSKIEFKSMCYSKCPQGTFDTQNNKIVHVKKIEIRPSSDPSPRHAVYRILPMGAPWTFLLFPAVLALEEWAYLLFSSSTSNFIIHQGPSNYIHFVIVVIAVVVHRKGNSSNIAQLL